MMSENKPIALTSKVCRKDEMTKGERNERRRLPLHHSRKKIDPLDIEKLIGLRKLLQPMDRYFTQGRVHDKGKMRDVFAERNPYRAPPDLEIVPHREKCRSLRRTENIVESQLPTIDKGNFSTRQKADQLERINIEEVHEIRDDALAINPYFFKVVQGRCKKPEKFSSKKHVDDLRNVFNIKLLMLYKKDEVYRLTTKVRKEENMVRKAGKKFDNDVKLIEKYVQKKAIESLEVMQEADTELKKRIRKGQELEKVNCEVGSLKYSIAKIHEKFNDMKVYQRFLHRLSPLQWRLENDPDLMPLKQAEEGEVEAHLSETSVGTNRARYSRQIHFNASQEEAALYFTEPSQLMTIIQELEEENIFLINQTQQTGQTLDAMVKTTTETERKLKAEYTTVRDEIQRLTKAIDKLNMKLEGHAAFIHRLLSETDANSILSMSKKLYEKIEGVYERFLGKNENNLTWVGMMRCVEERFLSVLTSVEDISKDQMLTFKVMVREMKKEELRVAQREEKEKKDTKRLLDGLMSELQGPTKVIGKRVLMYRSPIKPERIIVPKPDPKAIKEAQIKEYFFT